MRWIGIDPGLRTTGFGVIDVDGQKLTYVASGTYLNAWALSMQALKKF
jgi:Holliday junction resolvasome RuvABC endonuclease subunit